MRQGGSTIVMVSVAQVATVGLGVAWGLGTAPGARWFSGHASLAGGLAVILLGSEWPHYLVTRRSRITRPIAPWISLALGCHAAWLMFNEAFLYHKGDASFIRGILLLLPFLLALGPLLRAGAWLGTAGSALFFATSLGMLISNGCTERGGSGFFDYWIT